PVLATARRREPENPTARQFLGNAHAGRAKTLAALGRDAEALKDWDQALALDGGPNRAWLVVGRSLTWARLGDHARATAEAEGLAPGQGRPRHRAARPGPRARPGLGRGPPRRRAAPGPARRARRAVRRPRRRAAAPGGAGGLPGRGPAEGRPGPRPAAVTRGFP